MNSNEPKKGLGCLQATDGGITEEHKHRRNKCLDFSSRVIGPRLSLCKAYSLMTTHLIRIITYTVPVSLFNPKQCKDLNTAINITMVNKYTLNKHMVRAALYNPLHMASVNYPNFKIIQDKKGILNLMKKLRWNSTTANNLLIVLPAMQSASGLYKLILMDTKTDIAYISKGWLTHI